VFGTWRGLDSFELCIVLIALALVLNDMSEKLGYLEWWWLGGIYNPNHQFKPLGRLSVDGRTGQSGAPPDTVRCATGHCPVRQPRHPAIGFRSMEL
jgi:hypothetical protein